jgi:hypothetical protein
MKKECHLCGEEFDARTLEWYHVDNRNHTFCNITYYKQDLNGANSWVKSRAQESLKSESNIFLCSSCHSDHNIPKIREGIRLISEPWEYDVTTKVPIIRHRGKRLVLTEQHTHDSLLKEFTTLLGNEVTFEDIALVFPPESVKYFERKIRGRIKRLRKQWRDREAIREKKESQRKERAIEIARAYTEIPLDVIPAIVKMSGKKSHELSKIAYFFERLAARQYWQDQSLHQEAAELSKVIGVMET